MKKKIIILSLVLLLSVFTGVIYAQDNEKVEVTIPKFDIKINGTLVDNQHNKFPMIIYKNITYLPLTEDYSDALGLSTLWDSKEAYLINHDYDTYDVPKQDLTDNNDLNAKYYAETASFRVTINGEEIINNQEEYPILFFRDTVYISLTWEFANKFLWKLYWDNEDGLSVVGNAPDVYDISIVGDWIYYREDYNIFKMKLDGSEKTKFADAGTSYQMIVLDDWIYYINGSDESRLYKIKVDGTNKAKLSDEKIEDLVGIDDWVYYIPDENYSYDNPNSVYKMTLDGNDKIEIKDSGIDYLSFPILKDGWIYYRNAEDSKKLYKIRTNGNDKIKLTDTPAASQQVVDDWIYYVDLSNKDLYRVRLDGSNNTKVLDEKLYYYLIKGDWLYYGNESDRGKLYKIKLDGTGKTKLNSDNMEVIDVIDEWIYYEGTYGVEMPLFLKLARTNINTGITENILPNGLEEFYYANGVRIEGQHEDKGSKQNNFYYDGKEKTTEELAQLSESIVLIDTFNEEGEIIGQGSGVVISDEGLIVTNLHVLYGSAYAGVAFEGMEEDYYYFTLNIINVDYEKDLAFIKLYIDDTMPIRLGDSDDINKGEKVVAIGNPIGLENTISDGIISGVRESEGIEIIQTTTPISPGSSGGALLNMKGELLGITSMTNTAGQSLNFAIPSKYIKELLDKDTTKMNMEISQKTSLFTYNESSMIFDCFNYFKGDKYLVNLFANTETDMDFNIFANGDEFKNQIEEFYTKNIEEILKEYDIEKYEFNLMAGRYTFSYQYDKGKITHRKWKEDKDLAKNKASKEKILRVNLGGEFASLDPQFNITLTGNHIINNMFEGLMREEDGKIKYGIAKKYTVSEDGRTYTFYLRDAKWSDGQPVTASDFEYSWKRALDPDSSQNYILRYVYLRNNLFFIKGAQEFFEGTGKLENVAIKAIDDKTLRVTLNEAVPYFPRLTALSAYIPVRKDVVEKNPEGWFQDPSTLICNGPFVMEEYIDGFKVTLAKNKEYYDKGSVKLDKIEMYMVKDQSISLAAYEAGDFDMTYFVPFKDDEKSYEEESFNRVPLLGTYYYMFNVEKTPINNVKVRKALSLAIDRKAIVDNLLNGTQIPAAGLVPSGAYASKEEFRALAGDYEISVDKANIAEAKKLLEEAGYPEGQEFPELVILYSESTDHKAIAEAIKEMWEKNLGIKVKLENVEWSKHSSKLKEGDFMISNGLWVSGSSDSLDFIEAFTKYYKAYNTGWTNGTYDKLIEDSHNASDKERDQLLLEAEKIIMDEMVVIPIYYYAYPMLVKDNISSWQRTGPGFLYFRNTELK